MEEVPQLRRRCPSNADTNSTASSGSRGSRFQQAVDSSSRSSRGRRIQQTVDYSSICSSISIRSTMSDIESFYSDYDDSDLDMNLNPQLTININNFWFGTFFLIFFFLIHLLW